MYVNVIETLYSTCQGKRHLKSLHKISFPNALRPVALTGKTLSGQAPLKVISLPHISEVVVLAWLQAVRDYVEPAMIFPVITLFLLVLFFVYYRKASLPPAGTLEWVEKAVKKPRMFFITGRHPMGKSDIAPIAVITAVFTFLALFRLGDAEAPQTFHHFSKEKDQITIELDRPERLSSIMFYTGLWTGHYVLELSTDGLRWHEQVVAQTDSSASPTPAMNQSYAHLFKWRYAALNTDNPEVRFIRLMAADPPMELGEVAIYGADGMLIPVSRISSAGAPKLFDEQGLVPDIPTYMNSMYFDEIYHGRTAYEHLRGVYPYETTHPPLGKEIIALSIRTFGMTPFGWRFPGAVFGVLMLIVLYIFIKNLFGKTAVAVCGTLLLGFDFMRFVQTRIATIDTFGVFFILLSYYFMYRYISTDMDASFKRTLAPLGLSGLFFGIGCASKWIAIYAGAGLAVIYIIRLVILGMSYGEKGLHGFSRYVVKTLLWSVVFFVIIPAVIYYLSYIPYGLARGMSLKDGMLTKEDFYDKIVWRNQKSMFSYHGNLNAEHPYSSWWYQWITDARPILYYNRYEGDMRSSFASFGNPVVWWGGFAAMVVMALSAVRRRDGKALFILIGYLSQLVPWLGVSRIVFIYHYFPSTLFMVLAISHMFNTIIDSGHSWRKASVYAYTVASGTLFAMFYPALTGLLVPQWYFKYLLRWIPRMWPM